MGSAAEGTTLPAKAPPPTTASKLQESEVSSLPAASPVVYSADWATAVHAYYSAAASGGIPLPFYAPPVWGSKMMSPYGTPMAYSPMYPVYTHSLVATAAGYPVAESGSNKLKGGGLGKSGDRGKVTSGSADDYESQSGGESGSSKGSSDTREDGNESQDATQKRSFGDAFIEGESSQPITAQHNDASSEMPYSGRRRTVSKLPVAAPGRATLPGPATNLNIGMEVRSSPYVGTAPKVRPNLANVASGPVGANGVATDHPWTKDEREIKTERRKQSNRESARRSRLRKQQECEDLARKVNELSSENSALKVELEQLKKTCEDLEAENASITEDLNCMAKTGIRSQFEGINSNSLNPTVGEGNSTVPQNPRGSN